MRFVIYALGLALTAAGGVSLYWAIDLIGTERGLTYTAAGATLLSGGVIVVALARVTQLLERLARSAPAAIAAGAPGAPIPKSPEPKSTKPMSTKPEPPEVKTSTPAPPIEAASAPKALGPAVGVAAVALAAAQAEAALAAAPDERRDTGEAKGDGDEPSPPQEVAAAQKVEPPPPAETLPLAPETDALMEPAAAENPERAAHADTAHEETSPEDATNKDEASEDAAHENEASENETPAPEGALAAPPEAAKPGAHDRAPAQPSWRDPRPFPQHSPPEPAAPPHVEPSTPPAPPPRLVGRYQANGVDYALYSDGSIEAERDGQTRRFASLVELKAFIETE